MASFRKIPSGKWEARIVRRGVPSFSKSFKLKSEAEHWAKEKEREIDERQLPKASTKIKTSLSEAISEYKEVNGKDSCKSMPMRTIEHDLGAYSIEKITRALIIRYLALLARTKVPAPPNKKLDTKPSEQQKFYSGSTIRQIFYALKKVMEWHADANDYERPEVFARRFDLPAAWAEPRERTLVGDEESRLLDAANKSLVRKFSWPFLIRFALLTGMRNQEMILARWTDLALSGKALVIPDKNSKTGVGRTVPLAKEARAIIENLRGANTGGSVHIFFEFEGKPRLSTDYFPTIAAAAGLVDFRFHDLRHHALTRLASSGLISVPELMAMSGHSNMITWRRYLRLFPNDMADRLDGAKLAFDVGSANVNSKAGGDDGS